MDRNNDNTVKTQPRPEDDITVTDPYPGPVVNPDRKSPDRKSSRNTGRGKSKGGLGGKRGGSPK